VKLVTTNGLPAVAQPDTALIKLVSKAHRWWGDLRKGDMNVSNYAASQGVSPAYLTRVVRLAFLAPDIVDAILAGRSNRNLNATALITGTAVAALWQEQLL
jgi:site-specific DNA recombinase